MGYETAGYRKLNSVHLAGGNVVTLHDFCQELEQGLVKTNNCEEAVSLTELMLGKLSSSEFQCCHEWDCRDGCYARHLVFHGANSGCCIVAMSWGPGQGTPVHDHDGTWCVECRLEGRLEVVQYECEGTEKKTEGPLYRFVPKEAQMVGRGAVGCLIPPYEHHIIRNPFEERAVTLHVYGKELKKASCFYPVEDDLYRREERPLSYAKAMA